MTDVPRSPGNFHYVLSNVNGFVRVASGAIRLAGITSRGSNTCGDGGYYGAPYPAQPVYVERAPAYPERHYAPERRYAREPYYAQDRYYGEGRDYALEYAPRPPASVPYRSRARCDDGYGRLTYCD